MRILDLFCGGGGAAMGYSRAGFEVVGVDIEPQPDYPFEFIQGDALKAPHWHSLRFDAIHASPPCQAFSTATGKARHRHDDLIEDTRTVLEALGVPFVIENVVGAPIRADLTLCGSMFGLDVRRHRLFELGGWSVALQPQCAHHMQRPRFRSLDSRRAKQGRLASVVGVHGHTQYANELELRQHAMGIDWLPNRTLSQAIPPAYTEWIGTRLLWHRGHSAADPGV